MGDETGEGAVLDQLLTTLDVRVQAFAVCQTCPGWRLNFGPDEAPSIHYVLFGSGSMDVHGRDGPRNIGGGRKHLRTALYMPVLTAVRCNPVQPNR